MTDVVPVLGYMLVLVLVAITLFLVLFALGSSLLWLVGGRREPVDAEHSAAPVLGRPTEERAPAADDPMRLPLAAGRPSRSLEVVAHPSPGPSDRTCPFCKDAIAERSVHVECASCATWHHATCFEENGGCSVFGCREQRGRGVAGVRTGA